MFREKNIAKMHIYNASEGSAFNFWVWISGRLLLGCTFDRNVIIWCENIGRYCPFTKR